jgi:hypothetical protein
LCIQSFAKIAIQIEVLNGFAKNSKIKRKARGVFRK